MKRRRMGRAIRPTIMGDGEIEVNENVEPYIPTRVGDFGEEIDPKTILPEEEGFKVTPLIVVGAGIAAFLGYKYLTK